MKARTLPPIAMAGLLLLPLAALAQERASVIVLQPARVFDGETLHEGWVVRVKSDRIDAAGPAASIDATGAKVVTLAGATLMPGLVEGHSHILLHPYN